MASRYPFLDTPLPIAFAHRGGAGDGDENTMAAFERAVAAGYRYQETDVRATSDGVPIVFHDAHTGRLLGQAGRVRDLTWAALRSLKVKGAAVVPRLSDVLEAFPDCRFNIDIKSDDAVDPTIETVWKHNARDRVLLASFSDRRVAWVRRVCGPRQATSMGMREVAALRLGSLYGRGLTGFVPGVAAVQIPIRYRGVPMVDERLVRHAHRLGMQVHVWTVDEPALINGMLDLGVDGIMTDQLKVLRDVLTSRGLWTGSTAA